MNRAGVGFAATLVATSLVMLAAQGLAAQGAQAPPMKSVLQGKPFVSPASD